MARPKSDEKRAAILAAATRTIVAQGLGAPTMGIARAAGIANGSLFTYFETKTELLNQLYLELKTEMAQAAMRDLPLEAGLREQSFQMWRNWTHWAVAFPEKRRALAQLNVSDEITPATRAAGHQVMSGLRGLLERCREGGPMSHHPMSFVLMLMNSVAEGTMDFMTQDPAHAEQYCAAGFEALWHIVQ